MSPAHHPASSSPAHRPAQPAPVSPFTRTTLIAAWKHATTQKEKAKVEYELWRHTTVEERQERRIFFMARLLDTKPTFIDCRLRLLQAGDSVNLLWARVDSDDISLGMAATMLTDARKVQKHMGGTLATALEHFLREYDSWPVRRVGGATNGRLVHYKPISSFSAVSQRKSKQGKRKDPDLAFWGKMRMLLQTFIARRLEDADPLIASSMVGEFERELKVLVTSWTSKLQRAQQRAASSTVLLVTQNKVTRACAVLGIDPPKKGQLVDMVMAQRKKRLLAKTYHPDAAGDGMRAQYEAVLEAYSVLEDYQEMLQQK